MYCAAAACGQTINFDVPSICGGHVIGVANSEATVGEKLVQITIPVSASIATDSRLKVDEISVEVHWNRQPHPVAMFSPQTELYSAVDGTIAVEKRDEESNSAEISLSSSYLDFLNGEANGKTSNKSNEIRRYAEKPKYGVLVAAGTVRRGTGVKFRFKSSRSSTLEGSRELVLGYRVPSGWRGGIMQVTCRAVGRKTSLGIFGENFDQGTTFVMPVYLRDDSVAQLRAEEFAEAEERLRRRAELLSDSQSKFDKRMRSLFRNESDAETWANTLIQTGSDSMLESRGLPKQLADDARGFVETRRTLMVMGK